MIDKIEHNTNIICNRNSNTYISIGLSYTDKQKGNTNVIYNKYYLNNTLALRNIISLYNGWFDPHSACSGTYNDTSKDNSRKKDFIIMGKLILLSIMMLAIFGCATRYDVNMAGFGGQDKYQNKTYDFDLTSDIKADLEAMGYIGMLEKQLACIGWEKDTKSPKFTITPAFGVSSVSIEEKPEPRFGGSFGMFGGSMGGGLSLGSFIGMSTGSSNVVAYTKFLDIKLFNKEKAPETPVWQGKIFNEDRSKTLAEVMPVLIKFAIENFGKETDGIKNFSFDATKENLKALEECPKDK